MSDKLAISSALSVLLMASYVLFGGDAWQVSSRAGTKAAAPSALEALLLAKASAL